MFFTRDVLKNFKILTGKLLCWSLLLIKLGLQLYSTQVFPVKYGKIFRNTYFFHRTPFFHANLLKLLILVSIPRDAMTFLRHCRVAWKKLDLVFLSVKIFKESDDE